MPSPIKAIVALTHWLIATCFLAVLAAQGATVDGIRLWHAPDHTRIVFDISAPVEHKLFTLENPDRLVIDIRDTVLKANTNTLKIGSTPINLLRTATRNTGDLRVVLDLSEAINPRSFLLGGNEQYGDRLVVDLYDADKNAGKTVANVIADKDKLRDVVVAIDAGHGGDDPGAIGPGGAIEKEVVLAISKELKLLVDSEKGFRGVLVRTGDYYIPLRERASIARKNRADILISVHADAFKNTSASGASVYALSRRGATSETARYIAQRENRADLIGGVGSVSLSDKDAVLAGVLLDLSMTATLDSSLEIGGKVLNSLGEVAKLHKKRMEQAGFVVLKSPDVASILVETGFISNPAEAKRLKDKTHQRKLARAIFSGVKDYFYRKPPVGTIIAQQKGVKTGSYVIVKGDTLSDIAQRYSVSVSAIQRHNDLKSTHIRVGQRIKIPSRS